MNRNYISFYLMPIYALSASQDAISPALRKRMQGKSCFNFVAVDEPRPGRPAIFGCMTSRSGAGNLERTTRSGEESVDDGGSQRQLRSSGVSGIAVELAQTQRSGR
jgi:hypothetical protein